MAADSPLVTIIVPAYNAAQYLRECVDSILAQTHRNLEVIIVDDGSSDSTLQYADEYARRDERVRVLHKANGGLSSARNAGIDITSGDYVAFVDADDAIHPRFVEIALREMASTGAEIFSGSFLKGETCRWPHISVDTRVLKPQAAIEFVLYQRGHMRGSACCHLYKYDIVKDEHFTYGLWYEDLDYFHRVYERASLIAHSDTPLYFYRTNLNGILHTFDDKRLDVLDVVDSIEDKYRDNPRLRLAAIDRKFAANFNMFVLCARHSHADADRCWQTILKYRRRILLNAKSRAKNRFGAMLSYLGPRATLAISRLIYRVS